MMQTRKEPPIRMVTRQAVAAQPSPSQVNAGGVVKVALSALAVAAGVGAVVVAVSHAAPGGEGRLDGEVRSTYDEVRTLLVREMDTSEASKPESVGAEHNLPATVRVVPNPRPVHMAGGMRGVR
jgi:hypothetical protein